MTQMNADGEQSFGGLHPEGAPSAKQRDPETFAIIGAAMRVHGELGCGFLEAVYQEALALEFSYCGVPFEREKRFPILYRGAILPTRYDADFVCYGRVIVELKALDQTGGKEEAQVLNYLRAAKLEYAILLNFGTARLHYKRMVLSRPK
jgi:GxxExxY protein